jgi:NTP pyrophosphatase (non-canonical NTP hydrolase)
MWCEDCIREPLEKERGRTMTKFSIGLSDSERERLALLAEECGEVIQVIGKILRHGYESRHPNGGPTNRQLLAQEIGDIEFAIQLCVDSEDFDEKEMFESTEQKMLNVGKYLHFQLYISVSEDELKARTKRVKEKTSQK